MNTAQIHRFNDRVAIRVSGDDGNNHTVYFPLSVARKIADAMASCALDIEDYEFSKSTFKTFRIAD